MRQASKLFYESSAWSDTWWLGAQTLKNPAVLISSSDSGAHAQMMCSSGDTTLLLTRHALRDRVGRAAQRNKSFKAIDRAVRKEPWKVVALLRLAPVLPSGLKSYFLGLTCVTPLDYASASVLATLPTTALKVYVGAAGRDVLAGGGPLHWAALAAAVIAMLGVGLFVGRFAKSRLGF